MYANLDAVRYEEDTEMKNPEGEQTSEDREYPALLRATNGKNINISTRVCPYFPISLRRI